jgi:hypothetical protein
MIKVDIRIADELTRIDWLTQWHGATEWTALGDRLHGCNLELESSDLRGRNIKELPLTPNLRGRRRSRLS